MAFWRKIFGEKREKQDNGIEQESPAAVAQDGEKKDDKKIAKIGGGVLRHARTTEKTAALGKQNWYVFSVQPGSNKIEVKRAAEVRYGVTVEEVRIANMPGKERRRGRIIGWKPGFKKAMVRVKEGQSIEIQ